MKHFLNKIPGYGQLSGIVPKQIKNGLKQQLSIPIPSNPHISDKSKEKIRGTLKDELQSLFEYTGKPHDYWLL